MSIRERRKALGWSRKELARKAHIDPNMLQLVELGESTESETVSKAEAALTEAEEDREEA